MKNKLRMIDINFASAYLGRFLTVGVTGAVLAITISALTGAGGLRNHRPLVLELPAAGAGRNAEARFEPLRGLLAIETGRLVRAHARGDQWCGECDLYIFPIAQFLDLGRVHGLVPLYTTEKTKNGRNAAVLIAKKGLPETGAPPAADEVLFLHPRSFNSFWVQLSLLESEGFRAPGGIESLRFASPPGTGSRVIYSVALGQSVLGACRASDLADEVRNGGIGRDELSIIRSSPAVPEVVIACKPEDVDYWRGVLGRTASRMAVGETTGRHHNAIELMDNEGMRSLRPVSPAELERAASLYSQMADRTGSPEM